MHQLIDHCKFLTFKTNITTKAYNESLKSYYRQLAHSCSILLKQANEIKKTEASQTLLRVKSLHTPSVSVLSKRNSPNERERQRDI